MRVWSPGVLLLCAAPAGAADGDHAAAELGGTVTYPLVDTGCGRRLAIPLRRSLLETAETADV